MPVLTWKIYNIRLVKCLIRLSIWRTPFLPISDSNLVITLATPFLWPSCYLFNATLNYAFVAYPSCLLNQDNNILIVRSTLRVRLIRGCFWIKLHLSNYWEKVFCFIKRQNARSLSTLFKASLFRRREKISREEVRAHILCF